MEVFMFERTRAPGAACAAAVLIAVCSTLAVADEPAQIESRLSASAKYLSSDELEGRGAGTKGLDLAANYIAEQFRAAGLKTDLFDGSPFQKFKMTIGTSLGPDNALTFVGPAAADGQPRRIELKLGEGFTPLGIGGSGKFDLPLVFVGYGITGKEENYDDYAGVNVKDKVVVILRHEPQQANPHSVFDGTKHSAHAPFKRKVSNAYEHGAAAVIFVNDEFDVRKNLAHVQQRWQAAIDQMGEENAKFKAIEKPTPADWKQHEESVGKLVDDLKKLAGDVQAARDPLLSFNGAGPDGAEGRDFPVLFCRRAAIDPVIEAALGTSLSALETEIDKGPTPHSRALEGWRGRSDQRRAARGRGQERRGSARRRRPARQRNDRHRRALRSPRLRRRWIGRAGQCMRFTMAPTTTDRAHRCSSKLPTNWLAASRSCRGGSSSSRSPARSAA